jgi:hypothetical protein
MMANIGQWMRLCRRGLVSVALCMGFSLASQPASAAISFIFDYNGSGTNMVTHVSIPGSQVTDTSSGGHKTLFFNLPYAGVAGDLIISDPDPLGTEVALIRFDGSGGMFFYQDVGTAPPQTGLPGFHLPHLTFGSASWQVVPGYGPSPMEVLYYTPTQNGGLFSSTSAGYNSLVPAGSQLTFLFIVDRVPEPSSAALCCLVGLPILGLRRFRMGKGRGVETDRSRHPLQN